MRRIKHIGVLVVILLIAIPAVGQSFLHLTSREGLPDNHVRFVFQDESRYIYVGTRMGLCRYDGYAFTTATYPDSLAFQPREFSSMIEDNGAYYVTAASGIYRYSPRDNSLSLMKRLQLDDEACFARFNTQLFCGNSEGLFVLDKQSQEWIDRRGLLAGIENIHVRSILKHSSGSMYVGTNKGLFRFNKELQNIGSNLGSDPMIHDINNILEDSSGNIWVSTFDNLYRINDHLEPEINFSGTFDEKHIRSIEMDPGGRIWVGGEFGISIITLDSKTTDWIYRDISREQGLNDNAVYALFCDLSENMWVGTYFGGVNLWNSDFDKFSVIYPGESENTTSGKVVREMVEAKNGNLWLALEDGGLNYLRRSTGIITRYFYNGPNDYKNIHSLALDENLLWTGSFDSGLECFRITNSADAPILTPVSSYISDRMVFDIEMDENGILYAGSVGQVFRINPEINQVVALEDQLFQNLVIYTLHLVSENELLLGTLRNGLYYYNTATGILKSLSTHRKSGMHSIAFIGEEKEGEILIACSDGLYTYTAGERKISLLRRNTENSEFRAVLRDKDEGYWITTTSGLIYAVPEENRSTLFNRFDGLPENQFNFNSAFRCRDGQFYFGTYNGLIHFEPEVVKHMKRKPPLVSFTSYTVLGEDKESLTTYFLDHTVKEIRLKSFQKMLTLEFSALGNSGAADIDYRMRMEGENNNWDRIVNSRSVTLSSLSPGWHKFEVRAEVDGVPSPYISELNVFRQPTPWQTIYAWIGYGVLFLFMVFIIRRDYLRRQIGRQALAMERMEKKSQKKLNDQKMQFFLNISHEFRTPLTIIAGTITNIRNKFKLESSLNEKLEIIQNNSENLNNLVDDFLEYEKLDAGFKPMDLKRGMVMQFIRKASDMFDNWAEVNQLDYQKGIADLDTVAFFDPFKLERILYNLLSNAFKFNVTQGRVIIQASITKNEKSLLELKVADSGRGMDKETLMRVRRKFSISEESESRESKGIGLNYTAGVIDQLGGEVEVSSELGKGTTFWVRIPILLSESPDGQLSQREELLAPAEPMEELFADASTNQGKQSKFKTESVLIIDDNTELLNMLAETLSDTYDITFEASAIKAIEVARRTDFSLIICDIMMPEMNGFEVIDQLHADLFTSHIPILILTAAADREIEMKGYRKGAVSYMSKPFRENELRLKIDSILSMRRELINRYGSSREPATSEVALTKKDEEFLEKARKLVFDNLEYSEFDVDQFCKEMNISRSLLHTKLKHITGLSTTEFVRNIRLKQAYVLLKRGGYPVAEVAFKCGFNDPAYFSRCFTKLYNITPSRVD